jgi:HNH endonuclease
MSERVSKALRHLVVERAGGCCEYCGMPDDVMRLPHEPDHIIATQHGGHTNLDNLAYTCFRCNRFKGPNLASIDPETAIIVPLYNPRTDDWHAHFRWEEAQIVPLTAVGRATIALLRCNDAERVALRANLIQQGRYPFLDR